MKTNMKSQIALKILIQMMHGNQPVVSSSPKIYCIRWNVPSYNCDPLKPHFYIVKLGFTGIYIIFLISA